MSYPTVSREHFDETRLTEPAADGGRRIVPQRVRFRLTVGSGLGFTDEIAGLLRSRLRFATLIVLVGFVLHFLRNLLLGSAFDYRPLYLVFSGCEMAVLVIASACLWSRRPLSMSSLLFLELAIFSSIAAFFGWLHV